MLPWRWHVRRIRLGAALSWCLAGFCFAILVAAVAPMLIGLKTYTVRSGSMTPAVRTGDVIVARQIVPTEASVGEIVTFKDPAGGGELITHRVRAVDATPEGIRFVTRGDANDSFERWSVPADGRIGELAYRIPLLGFPLAAIGSPLGKLGLIVLPSLVLLVLGLLRIWSPDRLGARPSASEGGA